MASVTRVCGRTIPPGVVYSESDWSRRGEIEDSIEANLNATAHYVSKASALGVDILAFPEAILCGYSDPRAYPEAVLRLDGLEIGDLLCLTRGFDERACRSD